LKAPWYRNLFGGSESEEPVSADPETNNSLGVWYSSKGLDGFAYAAACFQKAADQGHAMAQNNLALMYALGLGLDKNTIEAARWFQRSADQGDAGAQYHLGVRSHRESMLSESETVREARIEAYKWFQLAARQGYWKADVCLERVNLQMDQAAVTEANRRVTSFVPKLELIPSQNN